jgi:benzoyl-CoA reductase/2-hydroxyglutaryl-CoA dehydratase subunit BcrC/BadD/HgdB
MYPYFCQTYSYTHSDIKQRWRERKEKAIRKQTNINTQKAEYRQRLYYRTIEEKAVILTYEMISLVLLESSK